MHLFNREELQKYVNRSVNAYFDLDNDNPNSVIFENYELDDDQGEPFKVIAKYFYLPN